MTEVRFSTAGMEISLYVYPSVSVATVADGKTQVLWARGDPAEERKRIHGDESGPISCGKQKTKPNLRSTTVAMVITSPPGGCAAIGGVAAGGSMDEQREHLSSRPRPPAFLAWRPFTGKQALALASQGLNSAGGTLCAGTDQLWPNQKSL